FCFLAKKCRHPGDLQHGYVDVTDLSVGSKAVFSCTQGYRLIGPAEIFCEVTEKGVDWSRDLPLCEVIACSPPPNIANGHYTESSIYVYQTTVTYSCNDVPRGYDPFSLIGPQSIFCTYDANSNGVWSEAPPECRVVKCENPKVEHGRKLTGFGPSYTYRDSVTFECEPGYFMVGSDVITCGADNNWSPSKPTCEKISAGSCGAPEIRDGVVVRAKPVYAEGERVQIHCNAQCAFPDGAREMTITCQGQNTWSSSQNCVCGPQGSGSTPLISYGRVIEGQKPSYSVGDFITIECYAGYTLHGEARIQYVGENQWNPGVPTCHLSKY
ncbi:C4BPA protein, partial [Turnix velox]|nr:C4BPA protein [Turnix velox]